MATTRYSPFIGAPATSTAGALALVHLKRDQQVPILLNDGDDVDEGYAEGKVLNTQFGSFPHSTLTNLPWGSQVRASHVDTGSRGRRKQGQNKKRKRGEQGAEDDGQGEGKKQAVTAASGFVHLLAPTPENWTASLPHRTQVVYTPDYSYILHRIRARPGSRLIEAGAGSGSFTHASARAVFNGWPESTVPKKRQGKVWSFEFHEQRHEKLVEEIKDHGLDGVVEITHRDVCEDGFLVGADADQSPKATSIFLDLPAPWIALKHLVRSRPAATDSNPSTPAAEATKPFVSPLDPKAPVHICTFSPCIEQVQRTVSAMRRLGWVNIDMVEIANRRIDVRRERVGIEGGPQRGVLPMPASVEEALDRLREVEGKFTAFHGQAETSEALSTGQNTPVKKEKKDDRANAWSKATMIEELVEKKIYKDGKLVTRTESDVKSHTSYLVFAVLPMEWTAEDEARAKAKWPITEGAGAGKEKKVKKPGAMASVKKEKKVREVKSNANGSAEAKTGEAGVEAKDAAQENGDSQEKESLPAEPQVEDKMDVDPTPTQL